MPTISRLLALALALAASACGAPNPADVTPDLGPDGALADDADRAVRDAGPLDLEMDGLSISSELDGDLAESVTTEDGAMEIGVTDRVVYSRLSKESQDRIAQEMRRSAEEQQGLGGRLARRITDAVAEGIGTAVQVPLADVRDVRTEGGRLVIEMADGEPSPFERAETDGRSVLDGVSGPDAERLAEAFREVRGGR